MDSLAKWLKLSKMDTEFGMWNVGKMDTEFGMWNVRSLYRP
jgi:hypothetical protein